MKAGKIKKLLTGLTAMAMAASMIVPASAAGTFQVTKALTGTSNKLPSETFNFTLTPATQDEINELNLTEPSGLTIYPGVAPTDNTASIVYAEKTTHTAGTAEEKNGTFDLAGANFDAPGVYVYKVTETAGSTVGMTYDLTTKYVYVYVIQNGEDYEVAYVKDGVSTIASKEPITFDNTYDVGDVEVYKVVSGTSVTKGEAYPFTITLNAYEGSETDTTKKIGLTSGTVTAVKHGQTGDENVVITIGTEAPFTLKQNEWLEVSDLPVGMTYTVTETNTDSVNTYTTKIQSKEGSQVTTTSNDITGESARSVSGTVVAAGNTETFTNSKSISTTGVLMEVAPYVVVFAIAAAGVVLLALKNKRTAR